MTSPDPRTRTTGAGVPVPEVVALDHHFDGDGLYGMRATVAAHIDRIGIDSGQLQRLLIVASELASNAIRHGGGTGRLCLWRAGDRLYCQVSDQGVGITDPSTGTSRPSSTQIGGRGLWIARSLSEDLHITNLGRGTAVTAVMLIPTAGPEPPADS